jgi:DNA-binding transcriptional MocR family regulator
MTAISTTALVGLLGAWRTGGAAHRQLAATIRALVLDARVPLDSRLPAERELAAALGVSRTTVTAAYNELRRDGYLASRQGSGSFVTMPGGHRAAADAIAPAGGLDLRIAAMAAPPRLAELARDALGELPRWLDHHGYEPLGLPPLRDAIARRFTERGLPTRREQILVTSGALQPLDLMLRATFRRGRPAVAEMPAFPSALDSIRLAGARLAGLPIDADGWDLEQLEALAEQGPALAYVMPDFQNPTGALVDESSRRRALRAFERAGTAVVVDESFVELNLDDVAMPLPAACFGGARTITVGSLGKAVWGGLRIGWARCEPALIRRLAASRATTDLASPVLEQLVAARVLSALDDLLPERRDLLRLRRDVLVAAVAEHLPAWRFTVPAGGLTLWLELPEPSSTRLAVQAAEHGVQLTPGPRFGAAGLLERYLRLPFTLPPDQLVRAVSVVAALAPHTPQPAGRPEPAYAV